MLGALCPRKTNEQQLLLQAGGSSQPRSQGWARGMCRCQQNPSSPSQRATTIRFDPTEEKKKTLPSVGSDPEKQFSRHGEHGPNCSLHRSMLITERGKQRTKRDARPAARRRNAAWNSVWGSAAQLKASRLPCALRPEQRRSRHRPAAAPPLSAHPECVSCPARCSLLSHPRVNAAPRAGESSPRSGPALPVTTLQHR